MYNPFSPNDSIWSHWIPDKIKLENQDWKGYTKNQVTSYMTCKVMYLQYLRPALRYDYSKLIRITCQAACHGKTEPGIFVKFEKPSKTAVVFIAGVTISGTPYPRHITVPFSAGAPPGHVA